MLHRYEILDTPADGAFDAITALAAVLLKVPVALISLVDADRIWFKSRVGIEVEQTERCPGLCASAILGEGHYMVCDTTMDPRTSANPLVVGEFGPRFYAAAPLRTRDGFNLGTLCVLDLEPRELDADELAILVTLAGLVMEQLELRRDLRGRTVEYDALAAIHTALAALHERKDLAVATAAHDLRNPLGAVMMMAKLLQEEKFGPLNARQHQMVESICESSDQMLRLVKRWV
jgi:GAF domain-containing protein